MSRLKCGRCERVLHDPAPVQMDRGTEKRWREKLPTARDFAPFGPQVESCYQSSLQSTTERRSGHGPDTSFVSPWRSLERERTRTYWRHDGQPWSTYGDPIGSTYACKCGRNYWLTESELTETLAAATSREEDAYLTDPRPIPPGLSDVIPFDPRDD